MWPYAGVFLASLIVDSIPVFAPPAWTLMVVFVVKYKLDVWKTVAAGSFGSTLGRWCLSRFMPKIAHRLLNRRENENIAFAGRKLGGKFWPAFTFTLLYSLTPLSTTALFTAAGAARVNPLPILPAFLIGKFFSDAVMVFASRGAIRSFKDVLEGQTSPKALVFTALGLLLITATLFIDWRELLDRRRLTFRFNILR